MLEASARRIEERLADDALVLDVGAWAQPFARADWAIDLQPHETRGLYGYDRSTVDERFSAETWVVRDICERRPWPFADRQFDFVVCAHTLEDVRDPVWVCAELQRVAREGYVEVPSRLEEQSLGVEARSWAGWSHHRWLCDVEGGAITLVHKPGFLHASPDYHLSAEFHRGLTTEQRVSQLWWEDGLACEERVFVEPTEAHAYLAALVHRHDPPARRGGRVRKTLRAVRRA